MSISIQEIENILYHLNYRWIMESLAVWKGERPPIEPHRMYEGYEEFLDPHTLEVIEDIQDSRIKRMLKYTFIDHYIQRILLPHETEMRTWMRGAAAHVNGQKIYFGEIIPWCQKKSTREQRLVLQKEVGPLCKFLRPFAVNYWQLLLKVLKETFDFKDYASYCQDKKQLNYQHFRKMIKGLLEQTKDLYFPAMEAWVNKRFNVSLQKLTRFDAICILGMSEFDRDFPQKEIERLTEFFRYWNMDIKNTPGLNLDLSSDPKKSAQAMCFILQVPDEIYLLVKPQGGWVDLESVWHELGHGLFAAFTSPSVDYVTREMATTNILSETFAFLIQNIAISVPFLTEVLGMDHKKAENLYYYKVLKDLSIFRRYAARFLSEYEMFSTEDLACGDYYSELMTRSTGFYYQPESTLFDLVPEFYSLDYIIAWITEAILEAYFKNEFGDRWMFREESGEILKTWWEKGNSFDIFEFLQAYNLGDFGPEPLVKRWNDVLSEVPYK